MPTDRAAKAERAVGPQNRFARLWRDFVSFFVRQPGEPTHIDLSLPELRQEYDRRVFERVGVSVADNDVLNIHRIGINAPPDFVWQVWARRDPEAYYWPTRIAFPSLRNQSRNEGALLLFGRPYLRLFRAVLIRRHDVPQDSDPHEGRYALYRCTGGYPIGIFGMYARPRNVTEGDIEPTQVFFLVAFDFFGRKHWLGSRAVRPIWESIHNRVTTQVLNRFKAHCESAYARAQEPELVANQPPPG
jgi:hypothetical protein